MDCELHFLKDDLDGLLSSGAKSLLTFLAEPFLSHT